MDMYTMTLLHQMREEEENEIKKTQQQRIQRDKATKSKQNNLLLTMIGLPGSGKSTICQLLKQTIEAKYGGVMRVIHLEFDKIIRDDPSEQFRNAWKNPSQWKFVRDLFHEQVEFALSSSVSMLRDGNDDSIAITRKNDDRMVKTIVLVDDNSYYKSMRKWFRKCAERYNFEYGEIYFHIEKELAKFRNSLRSKTFQVQDEVIDIMHERIEFHPYKNAKLIVHLDCNDEKNTAERLVDDIMSRM